MGAQPRIGAHPPARAELQPGLAREHHVGRDADAGDDKVEAAAARTGKTAAEIAAEYTDQWRRDPARLGCLAPSVVARAPAHLYFFLT